MKTVIRSHVCGHSCFQGKENCNGYCTDQKIKAPGTFTELVYEEIDHWKDVLEIFAEYLPEDGFTIYDKLIAKYEIKPKP